MLRDDGLGAVEETLGPAIALIILFALMVAAVGGGGLILTYVLTVATRPLFRRCPDSVCDTLTGHGVFAPHASTDHAELAGPEQAQREAARARCCGRLIG